jgi:biotin carboxyl carrier protein
MGKYIARAEGREHQIELSADGKVHVDGATTDVALHRTGQGLFLRIGNSMWSLTMLPPDEDSTLRRIAVNGRLIQVEVDDETSALLRRLQSDKATQIQAAVLRSPMPGRIARVLVTEGEFVESGQGVLILEAMKMENEIKAPSAGIVKAVRVQEGDAVEKNTMLIELS